MRTLLQISCVGGFGSNSHMYKINGTANINAIRAAAEEGITKHLIIYDTSAFALLNDKSFLLVYDLLISPPKISQL